MSQKGDVLSIEETQDIVLEILRDIFDFSQQKGIKIFLLGGTALGAIREGGLIPWDDDLDIGLLRSDYEYFLKEYTPRADRYRLVKETDKDSYVPYSRVVDIKTQAISEFYQINHGVFIDIFPIDEVSNNKGFHSVYWIGHRILNVFRNIARSTGKIPDNAKLKKLKYFLNDISSHSPKQINYWVKKELNWAKKFLDLKKSNNTLIGVLNGFYGSKEMLPMELLRKKEYIYFYDMKVYVFGDVDQYLKQFFGENWQVPVKNSKHAEFKRIEE